MSTSDVVYDLGSGDGRVVIAAVRDFHARRAVGVELDAKLVEASRSNAVAAGVADRVRFIHGDLFTNDFTEAPVLALYLWHGANLDLRPKIIRTLKPGTRVGSHQFGMGEWTWDKRLVVRRLLLGMEGDRSSRGRRRQGPPDGWLIGEAIMDEGNLKGNLTFYPYPFTRPRATGTPTPPSDRLVWEPKRLSP